MQHVIVNKLTGEIDAECPICGYGSSSGFEEFNATDDGTHIMIEITNEEKSEIITSLEKDVNKRLRYVKKFDVEKATPKLADRVKIDIPIEIEMPGGKEIIGFNQKPENIVIKKHGGVK